MEYGVCPLSIAPMRAEPADPSEMVNQVLYGELFKVLETRKKWSRIRLAHDGYEGWIDNKQYLKISIEDYTSGTKKVPLVTKDVVQFVTTAQQSLTTVVMGSYLQNIDLLQHTTEDVIHPLVANKENIVNSALEYLNAPYLWGGRTHFGIDCSGFSQMVYRLNGFNIKRDASQQATQGEPLSFIEESEPGDLAFFDNAEGNIVHVGIMMHDNYIIHAHGEVRIDRIDHSGIYNAQKGLHTHKLRVIKKIV